MKAFSPDEVFIIIGNIDSLEAIQMLADYLNEYKDNYSDMDNYIFKEAILDLLSVLTELKK